MLEQIRRTLSLNRSDLIDWRRGLVCYVSGWRAWIYRVSPTGVPWQFQRLDLVEGDVVGSLALVQGTANQMLLKKGERHVVGLTESPLTCEWAQSNAPTLWEYLTAATYPDGTKRVPASLLVFVQDSKLKGMLRDKDTGLCLWVASDGLFDLIRVMDTALSDPRADWRHDRQDSSQGAKRVNKGQLGK